MSHLRQVRNSMYVGTVHAKRDSKIIKGVKVRLRNLVHIVTVPSKELNAIGVKTMHQIGRMMRRRGKKTA